MRLLNFNVKYTQTDEWVIGSGGTSLRAAIGAKIDQIRGISAGEREKRS